jgi:hypothetical protein
MIHPAGEHLVDIITSRTRVISRPEKIVESTGSDIEWQSLQGTNAPEELDHAKLVVEFFVASPRVFRDDMVF